MSFAANMHIIDRVASIKLVGELDGQSAPRLNKMIAEAAGQEVRRLVFLVGELTYMSSAGMRCLLFAHQHGVEIVLIGTQPEVAETIKLTGFDRSIDMRESMEI